MKKTTSPRKKIAQIINLKLTKVPKSQRHKNWKHKKDQLFHTSTSVNTHQEAENIDKTGLT